MSTGSFPNSITSTVQLVDALSVQCQQGSRTGHALLYAVLSAIGIVEAQSTLLKENLVGLARQPWDALRVNGNVGEGTCQAHLSAIPSAPLDASTTTALDIDLFVHTNNFLFADPVDLQVMRWTLAHLTAIISACRVSVTETALQYTMLWKRTLYFIDTNAIGFDLGWWTNAFGLAFLGALIAELGSTAILHIYPIRVAQFLAPADVVHHIRCGTVARTIRKQEVCLAFADLMTVGPTMLVMSGAVLAFDKDLLVEATTNPTLTATVHPNISFITRAL